MSEFRGSMNLNERATSTVQVRKFQTRHVPIVRSDGRPDFVLLIRVYYNDAKVVETVDGNAYARIGESRKKLTPQEVRELQIDKGQVDLEREQELDKLPRGIRYWANPKIHGRVSQGEPAYAEPHE